MRVLVIEPLKKPEVRDIDSGLKSLQDIVDGIIQFIYPFDDEVSVICNDEAKLLGMTLNRALFDEDGEIYDIIAGNMIVAGISNDGEMIGLSDELIDKYYKHFEFPERFGRIGDRIVRIYVE